MRSLRHKDSLMVVCSSIGRSNSLRWTWEKKSWLLVVWRAARAASNTGLLGSSSSWESCQRQGLRTSATMSSKSTSKLMIRSTSRNSSTSLRTLPTPIWSSKTCQRLFKMYLKGGPLLLFTLKLRKILSSSWLSVCLCYIQGRLSTEDSACNQ